MVLKCCALVSVQLDLLDGITAQHISLEHYLYTYHGDTQNIRCLY